MESTFTVQEALEDGWVLLKGPDNIIYISHAQITLPDMLGKHSPISVLKKKLEYDPKVGLPDLRSYYEAFFLDKNSDMRACVPDSFFKSIFGKKAENKKTYRGSYLAKRHFLWNVKSLTKALLKDDGVFLGIFCTLVTASAPEVKRFATTLSLTVKDSDMLEEPSITTPELIRKKKKKKKKKKKRKREEEEEEEEEEEDIFYNSPPPPPRKRATTVLDDTVSTITCAECHDLFIYDQFHSIQSVLVRGSDHALTIPQCKYHNDNGFEQVYTKADIQEKRAEMLALTEHIITLRRELSKIQSKVAKARIEECDSRIPLFNLTMTPHHILDDETTYIYIPE